MKNLTRVLTLTLAVLLLAVAFTSCGGPASDPDKAVASLKKADYKTEKIDNALALAFFGLDGLSCVVEGNKGDDAVVILYFKETDDAKKAAENVKDLLKAFGTSEDKTEEIKQSGKMVYFGTKAAIKAAK